MCKGSDCIMSKRQIDKFCPLHNGFCYGSCTFYVIGDDPNGEDAYCQINAYITSHTPNNKDSKRAKPLLEGSDKKK